MLSFLAWALAGWLAGWPDSAQLHQAHSPTIIFSTHCTDATQLNRARLEKCTPNRSSSLILYYMTINISFWVSFPHIVQKKKSQQPTKICSTRVKNILNSTQIIAIGATKKKSQSNKNEAKQNKTKPNKSWENKSREKNVRQRNEQLHFYVLSTTRKLSQ